MPDYAGTPLVKKLGVKAGSHVLLVNAPLSFPAELGPLPPGVLLAADSPELPNLLVVFVRTEAELQDRLAELVAQLPPTGTLWVAWPKQAANVPTDLAFTVVQRLGLRAGLVDTKICAIDAVWSGLRFVVRVQDRPAWQGEPPRRS